MKVADERDCYFLDHMLEGDTCKEKFERILGVELDNAKDNAFDELIKCVKRGWINVFFYFVNHLANVVLHVEKNQELSEAIKLVLNELINRKLAFDQEVSIKAIKNSNEHVKDMFKNKFLNTHDSSDENWLEKFLSHFGNLGKKGYIGSNEIEVLKLIGYEITDPQCARTICVGLIELVKEGLLQILTYYGFGLLEGRRLFVTAFNDFENDNDTKDKMESKLAYLKHLVELRCIAREKELNCFDCFPFGKIKGFTERPEVVKKVRSFIEKNKKAREIIENEFLYSINWDKPGEFKNVNINWYWVSKHQLDSIDEKQGWNILLLFINSKQEKKIDYGNHGRDLYEKDSDDLKIFEEIVDNIIDAKEKTNFDKFLEHVDLNALFYNNRHKDNDLNISKLSDKSNCLDNNRLEKIFSIIIDSVFNDKDNKYENYQDKVKGYIKNSGFVTPSVLWNQKPEILKKIFDGVQPDKIFVKDTIKKICVYNTFGNLMIIKEHYKNLTKCFWTPEQVKTVFGEEYYKTWMKNCFPSFFDKTGGDFINQNVYEYGTNYAEYKPYEDTEFLIINYGKEYLAACAKDKSINDVIMFFIKKPLYIEETDSGKKHEFTAENKKNVLSVIGKEMVENKTKMSREVFEELSKNENAGLLSDELKKAMENVEEIKEVALEEKEKDNVDNNNDKIDVQIVQIEEKKNNLIDNNRKIKNEQQNHESNDNVDDVQIQKNDKQNQNKQIINDDNNNIINHNVGGNDNRQDNNIIFNDNAKEAMKNVEEIKEVAPEKKEKDNNNDRINVQIEVDDNIINNNDKRIEDGQKDNIDIEQKVEDVNNAGRIREQIEEKKDENIINSNYEKTEDGQNNKIDIEQKKVNGDDNRQEDNIINIIVKGKNKQIINDDNNKIINYNAGDNHAENNSPSFWKAVLKVFGFALMAACGALFLAAAIITGLQAYGVTNIGLPAIKSAVDLVSGFGNILKPVALGVCGLVGAALLVGGIVGIVVTIKSYRAQRRRNQFHLTNTSEENGNNQMNCIQNNIKENKIISKKIWDYSNRRC